jgi:hypothetical protein
MAFKFEMVPLANLEQHQTFKFCGRCDEWLYDCSGLHLLTYADGVEPLCGACADQANAIIQDFMAVSPNAVRIAKDKRRGDDMAISLVHAIENAIVMRNQSVTGDQP